MTIRRRDTSQEDSGVNDKAGWRERARQRIDSRQAATTTKAKPVKRPEPIRPWVVTPADLSRLDAVRELLFALNDAYASTIGIEKLVENIPVLAERVIRRALNDSGDDRPSIGSALNLIGNMGLETELLGVLEDLTTCRAELEEAAERAAAEAETEQE